VELGRLVLLADDEELEVGDLCAGADGRQVLEDVVLG
jgi:hypothetical protein